MTAAGDTSIVFDPLSPGFMEDPYPHLGEIRNADPVHWTLVDQWALFAYDDVFALLRDPTLSVDDSNAVIEGGRADLFESVAAEESIDFRQDTSILNVDPPDHTRLRRLLSRGFTPNAIAALRPRIQELVDQALDRLASAGGGDVVAELAFTLPFDVISEMLGMPAAEKDKVRAWSEAMVKTLDPIITEDEVRAAIISSHKMREYIDSIVDWKRENPADDLMTTLIEAEEDGDRMSTAELSDQVVLLFVAGHETTVNLIGTGIYELLRHPEQLQRWREDPSLDVSAVDELLRFVSPVQMSRRITTSDMEIRGKELPRGSMVLAMLNSANRDPEKFGATADDLDLGREGAAQHISFGSGAHHCLGSALAKLEAQVAVGSFIRRFPNAKVDTASWNGRLNLRGLQELQLTL